MQLAKANDALKRSLDSLAQQPELQAFLPRVVDEAAAQTGADHGALFVYDEQMPSLSLSVAIDNKGDWPSVTDMEQWKRPFPSDITPCGTPLCVPRPHWFSMSADKTAN